MFSCFCLIIIRCFEKSSQIAIPNHRSQYNLAAGWFCVPFWFVIPHHQPNNGSLNVAIRFSRTRSYFCCDILLSSQRQLWWKSLKIYSSGIFNTSLRILL
ncbi:hypothetical protein CEXT_458921 [Caerostris extrusa]|uniref:Uncharacterized protein n=1 Tax=Caerostris extrusa TaxID=172846 RepID=A0AAV4MP40_CAEEX|nr:hypothetical protein CEXT_458921 [Caerostris extrusa]